MQGIKSNFIDSSARYSTGHLKVMTRAYADEADLLPNDLALVGVSGLVSKLREEYPELTWTPRTRFAGLVDIPDEKGETKAQGPITGLAVELFSSAEPEEKSAKTFYDNQKNSSDLISDSRFSENFLITAAEDNNQAHGSKFSLASHSASASGPSPELSILNLEKGLIGGRLPQKPQEILVGSELAATLNLHPGDRPTIISSTMTGALAVADFTVAGIIRFGITPLDRGMVVADLSDIQRFLDMEDAAGEIFGLFRDYVYRDKTAAQIARDFNKGLENKSSSLNLSQEPTISATAESSAGAQENHKENGLKSKSQKSELKIKATIERENSRNSRPEPLPAGLSAETAVSEDRDFLPVMLTLSEQGGLSEILAMFYFYSSVLVAVFVAVMSIVLWNAGLMSSLRRYGEIGVRLAMGEEKPHLYFSLIGESLIIGALGSAVGTALGLAISYYLQIHGLNAETFSRGSSMMFGNVLRAQVTPFSYAIGFIPGLLATFLGTAIAGIAVFRRKTSTLMKEFEA
jgi:putative ABC transport system permease protein